MKAAILAAAVTALTLLFVGGAQAATFTVNSTGDPGTGACDATECTLREAITAANANGGSGVDQIPINATGEITLLNSSLPTIQFPADIIGPGPALTVVTYCGCSLFVVQSPSPGVSISGLAALGKTAFEVDATGVLRLSGVSVHTTCCMGGGAGSVNLGNLTIVGSSVTGAWGPGISNSGSLAVTRTTIANNQAQTEGGGINNSGMANISDSTISGNSSAGGGGGITNHGTLTLTNSTLSENIAKDYGGAIDNFGANATTTLNSVTIAGNRANDDNDGFGDGGGTQSGSGLPARISATNTLYYGNTVGGPATGSQCFGYDTTSGGYNLRSTADTFCTGFSGPGDIVNNGFALGALALNGGLTQTRALPGGAAALDAGNPATPGSGGGACPATDQRGLYRGGSAGRCDIGAFELGATVSPPAAPSAVLPAVAHKKCKKKKKGKKRASLAKKRKKCKKRKRGH